MLVQELSKNALVPANTVWLCGCVVMAGAVSTNIQYLGALSGSIDLGFYSAAPTDAAGTFDPGIIGRVTLARSGAWIVPSAIRAK